MTVKRAMTVAAFGVFAGTLAVWLAAASTSGSRAIAPAPSVAPVVRDIDGDALAKEIARLHEHLRPTAAPSQGRNLFRFAPAPVVARPSVQAAPETHPALSEAAVAPRPALPAIKLIGVAEDAGANGPIRTAIMSAPGQLLLLKEGDTALTHYRVTKILTDAVELTDMSDATVVRLTLK